MPELILAILVLLALFAMPLISGSFAKSIGRPFWTWFLIGCLLPVISVSSCFFFPRRRNSKNIPDVKRTQHTA